MTKEYVYTEGDMKKIVDSVIVELRKRDPIFTNAQPRDLAVLRVGAATLLLAMMQRVFVSEDLIRGVFSEFVGEWVEELDNEKNLEKGLEELLSGLKTVATKPFVDEDEKPS